MVVYKRFQYKALTENIFDVLEGWLLMGGGHMWSFDCNEILEMLDFQSRAEKEARKVEFRESMVLSTTLSVFAIVFSLLSKQF